MRTEEFQKIIASQLENCQKVLACKATEYAAEDRLHNFHVAAGLQNVTPEKALAGMMAKHTISIYDMCNGGEYKSSLWDEKITDSINYLLLLKAVVVESKSKECVAKDANT